ncbi:hypothetical protein DC366_04165 [Pelagivirga sediminicola]|uniref:Tetratricopeptide repeat-like domain-containing protein n=1 Tax=Pelagivirga sediminicola TaxID=2170575 RepID=A0A2T7G9A7_9RHOB|nr:hypothetical protein [Pelagivirga sediminicola]PVA10986.1 hypothetical protein DC366_04165 [Pelagivirga sediminicola]
MSDSDSFIEEVSEEVRRDRLFGLMRRYGWIAILAVVILVGGAAYNEWRKAQNRAEAEALGDAILSALETEDQSARVDALDAVAPAGPGSEAVIAMMAAAEALKDDPEGAVRRLLAIADDSGGAAPVYRQIATLKAVMIPDGGMSPQARRDRLDGLALGEGVMRLLAEEQLAYLDIEADDPASAQARLRGIIGDAEATPGLRRRATQVIVALGGDVTPGAEAAQPEPDEEPADGAGTQGEGAAE